MKKIIFSLCFIATVAVNSFAQAEKHPKKSPEERTEKITAKLTKELDLNDDQKTKVKQIVLKREKERASLHEQFQTDKNKFKEANKKNKTAEEDELKGVLTSAQMEKYKTQRAEMKEKHKNKKAHVTPPPVDKKN